MESKKHRTTNTRFTEEGNKPAISEALRRFHSSIDFLKYCSDAQNITGGGRVRELFPGRHFVDILLIS